MINYLLDYKHSNSSVSPLWQRVWLFVDGEYQLRNTDGDVLATFDDPADISQDADAYPRAETEITDFDEWTEIKEPFIPFDDD